MKHRLLSLVFIGLSPLLYAQSTADLDAMDLNQLLNVDVITVSSRKPLTKKQVPGNVTVFNEAEIKNTGARNLVDLLRLVPGLEFGYDVQNAVGIGVRGNWAQEGKALLVIDGLPVNETLYATPGQFFDFPVHQIRQLEVIRGPGASFYGGYAELAVINIKTRAADGFKGSDLQFGGGTTTEGVTTALGSYLGGWSNSSAFVSAGVFGGFFARGTGTYNDAAGEGFDVYSGNRNRPLMVNAAAGYNNFKANLLLRTDNGTYRDDFEALPGNLDIVHQRIIGQVQYDWNVSPEWTLTPKLNFTYNRPWQTDSSLTDSENDLIYDTRASRISASVLASGAFSKSWNTLTGVEIFRDHAEADADINFFGNNFDQRTATYTNLAAFTQHNVETPFVLINAGVRFDYNSAFGQAVNPWAGLNREFGKWNAKLLWGNTFRAPSIENVRNSNMGNIDAERTRLMEMEVGYQLSPDAFLSATLFDQKLKDVIVYAIDDQGIEAYTNYGTTGSRGFEVEMRLNKFNRGYINLTYSHYIAAYSNVASYETGSGNNDYLGFSRHKATATGHYQLGKSLHINPNIVFLGKRHGYVFDPAQPDPEFPLKVTAFAPLLLVNLSVRMLNLPGGAELVVSVHDLLGQHYGFIQPYDSYASPLRGPGRELLATLNFTF
jgi:outer membrane cobalamin receptor